MLPAPLGHQLQAGQIVVVAEDNFLPTIASLRDMVWHF